MEGGALGRDLGTGDVPEVVHKQPLRRLAGVLLIVAAQLSYVCANSALTRNRYIP
jgi:hypothetical protein